MRCEHVLPLVSRYVDGELATDQAGPFRKHLLECHTCRLRVQESEALKGWFVDPEGLVGPAQAPHDFATKVTALAFGAEAAQRRPASLRLVPEAPLTGPASDSWAAAPRASKDREPDLSGFLLNLVGAAAVVLLMLSFGIKRSSLPTVGELHADSASMAQSLESLDILNEQEAVESNAETKPGSADEIDGSQE